jgi:hypothetical protein
MSPTEPYRQTSLAVRGHHDSGGPELLCGVTDDLADARGVQAATRDFDDKRDPLCTQ